MLIILIIFYKKENFKEYNSSNIIPLGIKDNNKQIVEKLNSIPTKQFQFQKDQYSSVLKQEEIDRIVVFLKKHFPKFLKIVRFKKEQQNTIRRYDIVFFINDDNQYNHVILTKIINKNDNLFFNTLEYGGKILPSELSSLHKKEGDNLFFIDKSNNKIVFTNQRIEQELNDFEKRKIQILLRRGRKAA